MRIFVTGAGGFIGRALVCSLEDRGHEVSCLVRDRARATWMEERPGLMPVEGDILCPGSYGEAIRGAEVVFHLAGLTKARNRDQYLKVNGVGTREVARASTLSGSRVQKIVYASSLAVAGPRTSSNPAREEDSPRPISHYGESKLLGEELLRKHAGDVPWTVVRPPAVYGPHDRDVFVYFRAAARGIVPVIGGGKTEISMAHVTDVAQALTLAAFSERSKGRVYYLSDGRTHTTAEIARALIGIAGQGRIFPVPGPVLVLAGLAGDLSAVLTRRPALLNSQKIKEARQEGWVCSTDRIRSELGYLPSVDLQTGLRETFDWYRENGWL